jgi:hypothetical protein
LKDLDHRSAEFKTQTGLIPTVVQCIRDKSISNPGYVLKIDAIGNPKRRLMIYSTEWVPNLDPIRAEFLEWATARIIEQGAKVAMEHTGGVFYYFDKAIPLRQYRVMRAQLASECEQQMGVFKELQKTLGDDQGVARCMSSDMDPSVKYLMGAWMGRELWGENQHNDDYLSFEECMADRSRVLDIYRARGYVKSVAFCQQGFSSVGDPLYRMTFFLIKE